MTRKVQGCTAVWLCSTALSMLLSTHAQFTTSENMLGFMGASMHSSRHLQQNVTPDCGLAFQPCCPGESSCMDDTLSCIARAPAARCEPCGTPFAQPCPQSPFCEAEELIPTTSEALNSLSLGCYRAATDIVFLITAATFSFLLIVENICREIRFCHPV